MKRNSNGRKVEDIQHLPVQAVVLMKIAEGTRNLKDPEDTQHRRAARKTVEDAAGKRRNDPGKGIQVQVLPQAAAANLPTT